MRSTLISTMECGRRERDEAKKKTLDENGQIELLWNALIWNGI